MENKTRIKAKEIFQYIGPGLLVTVGFIDPGNWASNLASGAEYGTTLLWVITLSTLMLIMFQHNVAHLGIVTGKCLAENMRTHFKKSIGLPVLWSAMAAIVSTMVAEILGGAIALQLLFNIPIVLGSFITMIVCLVLLFSNTYKRSEKMIVGFVSIIGFSFVYELLLIDIQWSQVLQNWIVIEVVDFQSIFIIMAILGAIIMPHNLFLHSEIIQSRQWNLENEEVIQKQLKYEFLDTVVSMMIGWFINSAMIILAAYTFYTSNQKVTSIEQAAHLLAPLLGNNATTIFAFALLLSGISSLITAMITSGTVYAGIFMEAYDETDNHTRFGILLSTIIAFIVIVFVQDVYKALLLSQMLLSIQLPITILSQLHLTSSENVMGTYKNKKSTNIILYGLGGIIILLNIWLFISVFL